MAGRVARYQADRTNQKMYFCRIYCQQAEQTQKGQLQEAHIESALMHLYGGYLAFLQEVARYYNLTMPNPSLQSISDALETKTQVSHEVMRLKQLLANDYLGDIEKAWQQIIYKPVPQNLGNESDESNKNAKLPVIDVMASPSSTNISVDMIRQWRGDLVDTIDSLREGMIEF